MDLKDAGTQRLRLAILCDFLEEDWPSMDLVADALHETLSGQSSAMVSTEKIRPAMNRRFGQIPGFTHVRSAHNLDRFAGRFVDYPALVRGLADRYDMFHIADHSYGHLAHVLPEGRFGVFCHDLDAFRCIIEPIRDRRPAWFRRLASRTLRGVQSAAVVFYSTASVRDEILGHGLVEAERLVHAPYGVAAEFIPRPNSSEIGRPYLLHVGSCIPRKRVDVLLDVFARVSSVVPDLHLVHVGGRLTVEHERQIERLGIRHRTITLAGLSRERLASVYSDASIVLLPSEAEGFGLPVIEALASGARVVASDIPVLREVGGDAVTYCPVGDVDSWAATVIRLILEPETGPDSRVRAAQADRYTWREHARIIGEAYASLYSVVGPPSGSLRET